MTTTLRNEHQMAGQGALLAAAFLWSTSGLLIKLIDWHPVIIAGTRSFIAMLFILVVRHFFPAPRDVKNRPVPLWAGAFAHSFTMLTFVIANRLTTSANAILLQYGAPVWTVLLAWWLIREKPRWEQMGALLMVIGGLLIFFRDGLGSVALLGDGTAVFSGMLFATYSVCMRMMKNGDPRDCILLSHAITAFIAVPFLFYHPPAFSVPSLLAILYLGMVQIGAASLLFAYGIKRISAVQAMLIACLEPICNPIWVFIVIGEKPSVLALIGGGVILAAVLGSSLITMKRGAEKRLP